MRPRRFRSVLLATAFVLPITAAAFTEKFDAKDIPKGWEKGLGVWSVRDGVAHQSEMGPNRYLAYAINDSAWKDYELTAKIRPITAANYAGALVRVQKLGEGGVQWSSGGFYYWLIGIGGTYSKLWEAPSGVAVEGNNGSTLSANKWNDIKIVVKGNAISCYLNGKLEKEYVDKANAHPFGGVGLATYDAEVEFDDVEVTGSGIPGLAVDPAGKTALRWAELRRLR